MLSRLTGCVRSNPVFGGLFFANTFRQVSGFKKSDGKKCGARGGNCCSRKCDACGYEGALDVKTALCPNCKKLLPLPECDYFTLFGLPQDFNISDEDICTAAMQLQRGFHPDRFVHKEKEEAEKATADSAYVGQACDTLRDPAYRAEYMLKLAGVGSMTKTPPQLLGEAMNYREETTELLMKRLETAGKAFSEFYEKKDFEKAQIESLRMNYLVSALQDVRGCKGCARRVPKV